MKIKHLSAILFFVVCSAVMAQKDEISVKDRESILAELTEIRILDQEYASVPADEMFERYGRKKAWEIHNVKGDSVNQVNQKKIKNLYQKYGYLSERKIGKEGALDFWLPIQHADNDVAFQKEMLAALAEEISRGSDDRSHFAMLEDRVRVADGLLQRFGTQVTYNDQGQAVPKIGLLDSTQVDLLRLEHDLMPLREYYNQMTEVYFQMNKDQLAQRGIAEPLLYK